MYSGSAIQRDLTFENKIDKDVMWLRLRQ